MRFAAFTGWRGVGALLVAIVHFDAYGHFYGLSFFRNGSLRVDFFFVLSGFVITHVYASRLVDFSNARDFLLRRVARLWPLQAATLLFCLAVEGIRSLAILFSYPADSAPFSGPAFQLGAILRNLTLTQALGFDKSGTLNVASWSISVEMYTYVIFAIFCLCVSRRRTPVALGIAAATALALAYLTDGDLAADPFRYGIFRSVCEFFVGYLVYRLRIRLPLSAGLAAGAEGPVMLLVVAFISLAGHSFLTMAAPLVFALMVYVFSFEAGHLSDLMKSRVCQRLGQWSFSIYMIHMPLLRLLTLSDRAIAKGFHTSTKVQVAWGAKTLSLWSFGGQWGADLALLVYLGVVVAIAGVTYRTIEMPGQRLINAATQRQMRVSPAEMPQPG